MGEQIPQTFIERATQDILYLGTHKHLEHPSNYIAMGYKHSEDISNCIHSEHTSNCMAMSYKCSEHNTYNPLTL